jgi:hypothetical protein
VVVKAVDDRRLSLRPPLQPDVPLPLAVQGNEEREAVVKGEEVLPEESPSFAGRMKVAVEIDELPDHPVALAGCKVLEGLRL